jgi:hypothetical protein
MAMIGAGDDLTPVVDPIGMYEKLTRRQVLHQVVQVLHDAAGVTKGALTLRGSTMPHHLAGVIEADSPSVIYASLETAQVQAGITGGSRCGQGAEQEHSND